MRVATKLAIVLCYNCAMYETKRSADGGDY